MASPELVNPKFFLFRGSSFHLSPPWNSESSQEKGLGPRASLNLKPSLNSPLDLPGNQGKGLEEAEFSTGFPNFRSEGAALERFTERFGAVGSSVERGFPGKSPWWGMIQLKALWGFLVLGDLSDSGVLLHL